MAELLGTGSSTVRQSDIDRAAETLAEGKLVAFPTETVYGLGADAGRADAVAGIFAAKGRPTGHPLIVHMADAGDLDRFSSGVSAMGRKLADAFWPGPLTIVVGRSDAVAAETVGAMSTVGLRVPDHPVALALLRTFGGGVAAPSANRFGSVSPTTAQHVLDDLGDRIDVVLDGGSSAIGVESTIIDVTGPEPALLRPGGIAEVELEAVLGQPILDGRTIGAKAPGLLASHYAPATEVVLIEPDRAGLALAEGIEQGKRLGIVGPSPMAHDLSWPLPDEANGYAAGLYAALRNADRAGLDKILVIPPSSGPLQSAVLDRLTKAAAPKG